MPSPYEPEGPQGLGNRTLAGRRVRVKTRTCLERLPRLVFPVNAHEPPEHVHARRIHRK